MKEATSPIKAEQKINVYEEASNIEKEKARIDAQLALESEKLERENSEILDGDISKIIEDENISEEEKNQMLKVLKGKVKSFIDKAMQPKTRRKIVAGALSAIAAGGLILGYITNLGKNPVKENLEIQEIELSQVYLDSNEEIPSIASSAEEQEIELSQVYLDSNEEIPSIASSAEENEKNDLTDTLPQEENTLPQEEEVEETPEGETPEKEVEEQEVGLVHIENLLNDNVKEILSLTSDLEFGQEGNLYFENSNGEMTPVLMFETDRHLTYPYEHLNEVKIFVIHYDGGPLTLSSGAYRTVFNTLNGLNREAKPSVHFCVDSYPIADTLIKKEGLGVIMSQEPNETPYKGRHVQIGINLETGAEDVNRVKTAKLYDQVGVGSDFVEFVTSSFPPTSK